jgi:hypothetical protein
MKIERSTFQFKKVWFSRRKIIFYLFYLFYFLFINKTKNISILSTVMSRGISEKNWKNFFNRNIFFFLKSVSDEKSKDWELQNIDFASKVWQAIQNGKIDVLLFLCFMTFWKTIFDAFYFQHIGGLIYQRMKLA